MEGGLCFGLPPLQARGPVSAGHSGVPSDGKKHAKGCEVQGKEAVAYIAFPFHLSHEKEAKANIARAGRASF